jgi:hypothetical protein
MCLSRKRYGLLVGAICTMIFGAAQAGLAGQWLYAGFLDRNNGRGERFADLASSNRINPAFSSPSASMGIVKVKEHAQHGVRVFVHIYQGEILCRTLDSCSVSFTFDDAALIPMKFSVVPPEHGATTSILLHDEGKFIELASKAKRFLLNVPLYPAGTQLLEFEAPVPLQR